MMDVGGEQVSELAALPTNAGIDEIREYLMRLHQWVRAREPVAAGDSLSKFVLRGELVSMGLVNYEPGTVGSSNATITLQTTIIAGGGQGGSGAASVPKMELAASGGEFYFAAPADITSASPPITVTANLMLTTGRVRFHAEAFGADHRSLGPVALGSVTATMATITSTSFVNGMGTDVRYVRITAALGDLRKQMTVYRNDAGTKALILELTRAWQVVAADEDAGDFDDVGALVTLRRGTADETKLWTFAIAADGCAATLNGGAGPVSNAAQIAVSVHAMSADVGTVEITATHTGDPDQTIAFTVMRLPTHKAVVELTDAATIDVDASLGDSFRVVLEDDRTLDNPTNLTDGQVLRFRILQDATGSRLLAYGSKYTFAGGAAPTLSTAASAMDLLTCQYDAADDTLACVLSKDFS